MKLEDFYEANFKVEQISKETYVERMTEVANDLKARHEAIVKKLEEIQK